MNLATESLSAVFRRWKMRRTTIGLVIVTLALCAVGLKCTTDLHDAAALRQPILEPDEESTSAAASSPAESWVTFESPDHDFQVLMPALPERFSDSVSTPIGAQPVTRFKASADGCEFDAGYLQRSANLLAQLVGEGSILESACDGTAEDMGGKVLASNTMMMDGHQAREVRIGFAAGQQTCAIARLVITDDRIYHAIVRLPIKPTAIQSSDARRFLDSLRLEDARSISNR